MKTIKILPKEIFKFEYDENSSLEKLVFNILSEKEILIILNLSIKK